MAAMEYNVNFRTDIDCATIEWRLECYQHGSYDFTEEVTLHKMWHGDLCIEFSWGSDDAPSFILNETWNPDELHALNLAAIEVPTAIKLYEMGMAKAAELLNPKPTDDDDDEVEWF